MKKTLLNHFFAAVGLLLTASIGAFAQTTSGVHKYTLTGISIEDAAKNNASTTATEDEKTVYLLNVGKYQNATSKNSPAFIGRGQAWGTEIVISNIPLPLRVEAVTTGSNTTYRLKTTVNENGTQTQGYIGFMMDNNDAHAYFDDRGTTDNIGTTFTRVTNATGVSADNYVYKMSHYLAKVTGDHEAGTYYVAALYHPHGTDDPNRIDHVNGFTEQQLTDAKVKKDGETEYVDNNDDLWMIVTRKQLKDYFKEVDAAQNDPAIATFLFADPDFARADTEISSWKTGDGTTTLQNDLPNRTSDDKGAKFGPRSKWIFSSNNNGGHYGFNNYYVGNGWHTDSSSDKPKAGQRHYGGQWGASILGQGKVYQDVTLDGLRGGWYAVRVSATTFRNETSGKDNKVKLFAKTSNTDNVESYIAADTNDPDNFVTADSIANDGKHEASVLIYVKGDDTNNIIPSGTTLTVGIDATNSDLSNVEDPAQRAWTCFDNFQLWYLGDPKNIVLLDEDKTDMSYINAQNTFVNNNNLTNGNTGSRTKSTVYMNRPMNTDKWNTLVLPFSIEEDVVLKTFGAGTVYAELEGATDENNPTTIYFNRKFDGIEKGKLYLIRPTNSQPTGLNDVISSSNTKGDGTAKSSTDAALAFTNSNNNSYWTFEAVDFGNDKDKDGNIVDYQDKVYSGSGNETLAGGTVHFAGTYIRHDDAYIPANSYVLSATNTKNAQAGSWYYRTSKTVTKGFRGWLQTEDPNKEETTNPSKAANAIFNVDGVIWPTEGTVTGIDNLTIDGMKVVIRDNNVYNLQGQRVRRGTSLEGLTKGIYVVNGKKVLVK